MNFSHYSYALTEHIQFISTGIYGISISNGKKKEEENTLKDV